MSSIKHKSLSHAIPTISSDVNLKTVSTPETYMLNNIPMHRRKLEHINELGHIRCEHSLEEEKLQQTSTNFNKHWQRKTSMNRNDSKIKYQKEENEK
jgi:hypothetical protein